MQKYVESETLELKEKYTDAICKEIVSFLNTSGGMIVIGVKDDGTIAGVDKIDETFRKMSDIITTQIEPNPQDEVSSEIRFEDGKTLIIVNVSRGIKPIYCQKKYGFSSVGCTIRVGTTCREMTPEQIRIRYEGKFIDSEYMLKKRASQLDLAFKELKIYYSEKEYHLDDKTFEANLNLRNQNGDYNLLAELLADRNNIPLIFVKFRGKDKSAISERSDYGYRCIITSYDKIKNRLQSENTCISDTTIRPRKDTYLFDYDCVNEAVLNALVHNEWTITEHTGHGVPTIVKKYGGEVFEIEDNYIRCTIPFDEEVLEKKKNENVGLNVGLNKTEKKVISLLIEDSEYTSDELAAKIGVTKRTIERAYISLQKKKVIERIGSKRDGSWIVIK